MLHLIILGIVVLFLLGISYVFSKDDFFSPSLIVCAIFFLSVIFAIRDVIAWEVPEEIFTNHATMLLILGLGTFVGAEQFTKLFIKSANKKKPFFFEEKNITAIHPTIIKQTIMLFIMLSLTVYYCYATYKYTVANGYAGGFNLKAIATFRHANTFAAENRVSTSRWYRFAKYIIDANVFICVWLFVRNVIYAKDRIYKNVIYIIVILISMPTCVINSSRGFILQIMGCCAFLLYIMMRRRTGWKRPRKVFGRILFASMALLIISISLFYFIQSRGLFGRSTTRSLLDHVTMYIGDPILNFYHFIKYPPEDTIFWGQETFAELNNLLVKLHIRDVKYSVQLEYRTIQGHSGNIYTFFRRPYHDFGVVGMCVITWMTSAIFTWAYYRNIYKKDESHKTEIILIIYSYFFYIIYLMPMLCQLCNMVYVGMVYFIIFMILIYDFLIEKRFFMSR